jgi:starch phosphorylase
MRALRTFAVRVWIPDELSDLLALASNLRWSWDDRTQELFRWVDPAGWETSEHDPLRLLASVDPERLRALAADPGYVAFLADVHGELGRYVEGPTWFSSARQAASPLSALGRRPGGVAYFSPEFGIAEALPQYSGGLGVLAGDHLKAASALGIPLVGVGLFYRSGYFRQRLDATGWQIEEYPVLDPWAMALEPLPGRVELDLAGERALARVWRAAIGRVHLLLLDTDVEENPPGMRAITDRLYGGDREHRLRQEILLGIGGVRALDLVDFDPQVFHTNEGHAGFLGLERIRRLVVEAGLSFAEAIECVRAATVFTTHTPVAAGMDCFEAGLMRRYFTNFAESCGVGIEAVLALGQRPGEGPDAPFNMAVMGLRLASRANGVSRLHGAVSRQLFADLWPGAESDDVPIASVTNGVHAQSWVSREMSALFAHHLVPNWSAAGADVWAKVHTIPDDQLWLVREQQREHLVTFVRERVRSTLERRAHARGEEADASWVEQMLDPRVLTIGFARRFASYKRATLLLRDRDRLLRLLLNEDRPVQIVMAGKAHPADDEGKAMIREIATFAADPAVRHRFVFVEDYDIAIARALYRGVDVWLNTPRRPLEACGTSGQKAALNGAINCSILDGWWAECFDGTNGWAIATEMSEDLDRRDSAEASSLFDLLERRIVPDFYDRADPALPPARWCQRMKASLSSLGPFVLATRMVRDYLTEFYEPSAAHVADLASKDWARGKALAAWKARVREGWPGVRVVALESKTLDGATVVELGSRHRVEAEIELGALGPGDVVVQLHHGPMAGDDDFADTRVVTMEALPTKEATTARSSTRFAAEFEPTRAGRYGVALRVLPNHPDLVDPMELGLVAWAEGS